MSSFDNQLKRFWRLLRSTDSRDRIHLQRRLTQMQGVGWLLNGARKVWARVNQRTAEDYVAMQRATFEKYAAADKVTAGCIDGDYVVGSWHEHDAWSDYADFLMKHVPRNESWVALDFGCGPGRNIRRWSSLFRRVDGVDISNKNLENARAFLSGCIAPEKQPRLFVTTGMDCGEAPNDYYDFVFSTICLQHICVHKVRYSILKSLYRCLKPGGRIAVQMGYGVPSPSTVGYYENFVQATSTNRDCDVAIASPAEPKADLESIGFADFEYWIRPVGPGDVHPNWIFFTSTKPHLA